MAKLREIVDFIFPRICHICGRSLSPGERYVCASCLSRIPRTLYHRQSDNALERRFMGVFPYRRATGHFFYSKGSGLAVLMHDLKYHRFRGLARYMGEVVASELLPTGFLSDIDMILPVPMHRLKQARRGYNQTVEIARGISSVCGTPVADNLRAVRGHRTQTSLSLEQRLRNTSGLFRLMRPAEVKGKSLLLLDDVCTTGTTLSSAAGAILQETPDAEITVLTLGVTF